MIASNIFVPASWLYHIFSIFLEKSAGNARVLDIVCIFFWLNLLIVLFEDCQKQPPEMFLAILTGKHLCNFIKKETLAQVLSGGFCEISKKTFFTKIIWATSPGLLPQATFISIIYNAYTYKSVWYFTFYISCILFQLNQLLSLITFHTLLYDILEWMNGCL